MSDLQRLLGLVDQLDEDLGAQLRRALERSGGVGGAEWVHDPDRALRRAAEPVRYVETAAAVAGLTLSPRQVYRMVSDALWWSGEESPEVPPESFETIIDREIARRVDALARIRDMQGFSEQIMQAFSGPPHLVEIVGEDGRRELRAVREQGHTLTLVDDPLPEIPGDEARVTLRGGASLGFTVEASESDDSARYGALMAATLGASDPDDRHLDAEQERRRSLRQSSVDHHNALMRRRRGRR